MTEHEVRTLLGRYNSGCASPEEIRLLETWYVNQFRDEDFTFDDLDVDTLRNEVWKGTLRRSGLRKRKDLRRYMPGFPVAAALFVLISIGLVICWMVQRSSRSYTINELAKSSVDVKPGGQRATLTLPDGRVIALREDQGSVIVSDSMLRYQDGTEIAKSGGTEGLINTISTPKGGQYHLVLPDGSGVWLNAESTLKYPSRFDPEKRSVELIGEAYFEIATVYSSDKKSHKPFFVISNKQQIEVLGTHFNVSAYEDEPVTTTTLLEGSVSVLAAGRKQQLVPGQQSWVQLGKETTVVDADVEKAIGWKNGEFVFYNERIEKVMKDIARWYDVEVIYRDDVRDKTMWGAVSKFENISKVLKMIELTGVARFDIQIREDNRRVYIMK